MELRRQTPINPPVIESRVLTASDIQDGDQYDARLEKTGWDESGYNDSSWMAAEVMQGENRNMVAQRDQPVRVVREMKPVQVTEPTPGIFVYDLGQNITGVARIAVKGPKGTTITLRHAERLNADGMLDFTNLKLAKATDTFVLNGKGVETFQPRFTFHGFRWVSVEGLEKAPAITDVTGVVIGTRLPETGSLQTSDAALNHLLSNIKWLQPPLRATAHCAACPSWRTMTCFAGEDDTEAGSRVEH